MEILAVIFTSALVVIMSFIVLLIVGTIASVFEDSIEKTMFVVCICIGISYVGVLIRIVGPIYRFFLGG